MMVSIHDLVIAGAGFVAGALSFWFLDWGWFREARKRREETDAAMARDACE